MILDDSPAKRQSYAEYKEYQSNGGTGSYDAWLADHKYSGGYSGGGAVRGGATTSNPGGGNQPINNPQQNNPNTPPPANNSGAPIVPTAGGDGEITDPPPSDSDSNDGPIVVTGDPDKNYTVVVDTSLIQSDSDSVDDLI